MDTAKINTILGKKLKQSQRFIDKGQRVPVTIIEAGPCQVIQIKNQLRDKYSGIQLGFGFRKEKNITKPVLGHLRKAGKEITPGFLKEVRINDADNLSLKMGDLIKAGDVLQVGDKVFVTGQSRGKGFTGVVKRHHFRGGPRTRGQSDRERAPGSIGQTTTPGRVYKGKRMAGRSGNQQVTVKNLHILEIDNDNNKIVVSGLVPGTKNSFLIITKAQ